MSATTHASTELSQLICPHCAGAYAISKAYLDNARQVGGFKHCWTCPYCKTERGYGASDLKLEIDRLKTSVASLEGANTWLREQRNNAQKEAQHFRKSRDGMKGVLAKTKKRISAGTCPCCQRTFQSLSRHMAHMHPDYTKKD